MHDTKWVNQHNRCKQEGEVHLCNCDGMRANIDHKFVKKVCKLESQGITIDAGGAKMVSVTKACECVCNDVAKSQSQTEQQNGNQKSAEN